MFKKPFSVNQAHNLSGADRKKLRRTLEKALGLPEQNDLDRILPAKTGQLEVAKLPAPSRTMLYLLDSIPMLIDTSGKSDLVPTVHALWLIPELLPQIYIKHAAVSQYIIGGADLMLPGVAVPPEGLPKLQKGALVSICVRGNPAPIAVGQLTMSSADAVERAGGKGKLVEVVQAYGDCLWAGLGRQQVPNEGYYSNVVVPLGAGAGPALAEGSEGEEEAQEEAQAGDSAGPEAQALAALRLQQQHATQGALGSEASAVPAASTPSAAAAASPSSLAAAAGAAGTAAGTAPAAGADTGTAAAAAGGGFTDMDELLEMSLLQSLHKSLTKDEQLPVSSSVLWAQHMQPCRPPGSVLDVKKSSHKKLGKFLAALAKEGLLQVKEDKFSGDTIITGVDRKHSKFQEYVPFKARATSAAGAAPDARPGGASAGAPAGELVIEEVFKASKELRPVFQEVQADSDALYSAPEAYDVAQRYVRAARLEEGAPGPRFLLLDPLLCDALFKGVIKKGQPFPSVLDKAELRERFLARMQLQTRVSRGGLAAVKKGPLPSVLISSERRQGNKRVTRISGVEPFLVDPVEVAASCQKRFACSSNVAELPGKGQGHEVVIQGNVIDEVADYLVKTYGVPKKYVQVKKA